MLHAFTIICGQFPKCQKLQVELLKHRNEYQGQYSQLSAEEVDAYGELQRSNRLSPILRQITGKSV